MQSPQIAARVVRSLNLFDDPQFAAGSSSSSADERLAATANSLADAITIRRVGQTFVITIAAATQSPAQSAQIANEYAKQYLAAIQESEQQSDQQQSTEVKRKLDDLRRAAQQADAQVEHYKISHGLLSAEGATMAEQETSNLNGLISQARADLAERQGRLEAARRQISEGGGGSDVSSALNSGTVGTLRVQEAAASKDLAQMRARYGPKHPAVIQQEHELQDIQAQIQKELDRIMSSLAADVNVASSRLQSLLQSQAQSHGRLAGNESAQVGYLDLQRKADAAKTIYAAFLNSSNGAQARSGFDQPSATLSSAAVPPISPAAPNTLVIYAASLLFAMAGGVASVGLAEFLETSVSTRADVERRLRARYLGALPQLQSTVDEARGLEGPEDYVVSHPLSSFAESFRSLRAAATLRGHRSPKVLAITSALPLEGKTTTAVCLARTLAMSGARTLLLDCDLRRHGASNLLLEDRPGLLPDVLSGTVPLNSSLVRDGATNLQFLGVSETPRDGRDLLAPNLIRILLAELREQFDYIVIDTAPVLGVADARSVAREADATIFLARWRRTSIRAADAAIDLLLGAEAKIVGLALTQVDVNKFGSNDEDLYGYHPKLAGYYAN